MKYLRLFRRYDSIKAAVFLAGLAVYLLGVCICADVSYAAFLRTPAEYLCSWSGSLQTGIQQISGQIRGYSRQSSAVLTANGKSIPVTMLSAQYLADCYGLSGGTHTIWMNRTAFSQISESGSSMHISGTLGETPFSGEIVCSDALPQDAPYALLYADVSVLHDAEALRICMNEHDAAVLQQAGFQIMNPEAEIIFKYEQDILRIRIRFGLLAAFLALLAAGVFLRYHSINQIP